VRLTPGGALARLLGAEEIVVNSLHSQGLDRVSDRLAVEAVAPDGTPEAVSVKDARTFAMGFQWHPEYKALANPISVKIFRAFGAAAAERARSPRRREGTKAAS
jgi:putative glutamine amidotransferase